MAIDFYNKSDKKYKNVLFSWDDGDFEAMRNVLSNFYKATGLIIDQYKTTRTGLVHIQLITELLALQLGDKTKLGDPVQKRLAKILNELKKADQDLISVGD